MSGAPGKVFERLLGAGEEASGETVREGLLQVADCSDWSTGPDFDSALARFFLTRFAFSSSGLILSGSFSNRVY